MKRFLLAVLLIFSCCCFAASKPAPADYALTVHVNSAELRYPESGGCAQYLYVTIGNLHYGLTGGCDRNSDYIWLMLKPGDYKGRLLDSASAPDFRLMQHYELLMPDGSKRKFTTFSVSE